MRRLQVILALVILITCRTYRVIRITTSKVLGKLYDIPESNRNELNADDKLKIAMENARLNQKNRMSPGAGFATAEGIDRSLHYNQ